MTAAVFSAIFVAALAMSLGIHLWLERRQIRHVLGHRGAVPPHFVDRVTLAAMDSWNQSTHGRTGLTAKVKASSLDEAFAEQQMLAFVREHVPARVSPMCGSSICQDRRFLARWMPALEDYFHYRNLDVSTLKELCRRWTPEIARGWMKQGKHEALADIYESIDELKYYRAHFLKA